MSEIRRRLLCVHTKPKEMPNYLCFTALEDGEFTLTIGSYLTVSNLAYVEYSVDEGATWVHTDNVASTTVTITTPTIAAGDKVLWRGNGIRMSQGNSVNNNRCSIFSATCNYNVSGVLMSLLSGKSAKDITFLPETYTFPRLFYNDAHLVDASELILAPNATAYCYDYFMCGCTSLTDAPALPATTLANYCYRHFFRGCTSLITAPELPALILTTGCYYYMYYGCSALTYIKMLATDISATNCLYQWIANTPSTGSIYRNPSAAWWVTGNNGLKIGWTLFDGTEIDDEVVTFADQDVKDLIVEYFGGKMGGIWTASANNMVNGGVRIGGYYDDEVTYKQLDNIKSIVTYLNYQGPNSSKITSLTSFDEFRYFPASNTTVGRGLQGMLLTHFTLPSDSVTIANYFMPNINNIRFDYPEGVVTINSVPKTASTSVYGNTITVPKIVYPSTLTTIGNSEYLIRSYTYQDSWIVMKATTPPTASANLAHSQQLDSSTSVYKTSYPKIYVPDASVDDYKAAAYWSGIASRITPLSQFATDHPDDVI